MPRVSTRRAEQLACVGEPGREEAQLRHGPLRGFEEREEVELAIRYVVARFHTSLLPSLRPNIDTHPAVLPYHQQFS